MTPRIYVGHDVRAFAPGADYALPAAAAHHVAQVLRMRAGDALTLFTGAGGEYTATIARVERRDVVLQVHRHAAVERESPFPVTLVQALIAADMMDWVVRKAVELGVGAIAPVQSARAQRVPAERAARRVEHWRQIAIAACEQCGRNRVPEILPLAAFDAWLEAHAGSLALAILDAEAERSLASLFAAEPPAAVAIGPEGGFTADELRRARERGASVAHLGRRVLRAETAAVAALATASAIAGDAR